MTDKPCDTCTNECVGGVIYGNCQQFLHWRKEINHLSIYMDALLQSCRPTSIVE